MYTIWFVRRVSIGMPTYAPPLCQHLQPSPSEAVMTKKQQGLRMCSRFHGPTWRMVAMGAMADLGDTGSILYAASHLKY